MSTPVILNGSHIADYESFVREFNRAYRVAFGDCHWYGEHVEWNGEPLDLDNFLEAPDEEFVFIWRDATRSKGALGHDAMAAYWQKCHDQCFKQFASVKTLLDGFADKVDKSRQGCGPTLFDYLADLLTGPNRDIDVQLAE